MELDVSKQLLQLGASWLAGFAIGLLYDVLRVLRRRLKASALLDGLFCLAALFALFTLGMSVGGGSLHIFMLAFFALGFASYMLLLSDIVLAVLDKIMRFVGKLLAPLVKLAKKICRFVKKCFSKANKWFNMRKAEKRKGRKNTGEENALHSGDGADGRACVRYPEPCRRDGRPERGKVGNGGAEGAAFAGTGGKRKARGGHRRSRQ